MLKNIFAITVITFVMISCGQVGQNSTNDNQTFEISELVSEPLGYEGTEVSFEGTITHMCRHSGDKIRVNQTSDQDYSIMVMLQDFQTQFNQEFEGKKVKVSGILKTEVIMPEEDHQHDHGDHEGNDHDHGTAAADEDDCASTQEAVEKLKEKGIEPNIFTFVEMTSFEILEDEQQSNEKVAEVN